VFPEIWHAIDNLDTISCPVSGKGKINTKTWKISKREQGQKPPIQAIHRKSIHRTGRESRNKAR